MEENTDWFEIELGDYFDEEVAFLTEEIIDGEVVYSEREKGKGKHKIPALSIRIDADRNEGKGYLGDPYVKICNSANYKTATKIARLNIKTGEAIKKDHRNKSGKNGEPKTAWVDISKDTLELLNDIIHQKYKKNQDITVYQAIKNQIYLTYYNDYPKETEELLDQMDVDNVDFTKAYGKIVPYE